MKLPIYKGANDIITLGVGTVIGFGSFWLTSHHKSPIHKRLPIKSFRKITLLPHIKIIHNNKHYHFHHWVSLTSLYILFLFLKKNMRYQKLFQGFLLGGILQGLCYTDRFSFIYDA